jgi:phosphoribosylformylglycinamidine synthase subunit PurQ / glutaminase
MKFGVIVFPGSNCDRDVVWVTQGLLHQPTRMIWHEDTDISDLDIIVVPGGFSYGDYLRCGAIARFSPAMKATAEHANKGKLVLGICNGALVRNAGLNFICDRTSLKVERSNTPWTSAYTSGEIIDLPIAHGEGNYYADADTLAELEEHDQVLFRYCTDAGEISDAGNPNGSLNNIAGICNRAGNVLGMMPHPERASDTMLGETDGMKLFQGLLMSTVAAVL